jgi:hypothetical protein
MKTYSTAIANYRAARQEFWQIDLLSFKVKDRTTGDPHWFHFSSRDDDEAITVIDQTTGSTDLRSYFGGGHIVAMDQLVRSEGTGVRNFALVLSGVSQAVQDMIQGYECRDAVFEWRIGEGEDSTGLLVDTPVLEFEGFVATIDREDAALAIDGDDAGATTMFKVSVVSHIDTLQRANADMRSPEVGQERSGDDIFLYTAESNTWEILWGKKGHQHKRDGEGRNGRDGRDGGHSPDIDPYGRN